MIYVSIATVPTSRPDVVERINAEIKPPGNMKKKETIEKWEREARPAAVQAALAKTALGSFGEVFAIAWALDDGPVQVLDQTTAGSEGELLFAWAEKSLPPGEGPWSSEPWCVHSVWAPLFLARRCAVHSVYPARRIPFMARPDGGELLAIERIWAGYGQHVSLDEVCSALGISDPRPPLLGQDVPAAAFDPQRWSDVLATVQVNTKRLRLVHSRISPMILRPNEGRFAGAAKKAV